MRGLQLPGFTTKALNAWKRFLFFVPLVDTAAGNLMLLSPALSVETWEATIIVTPVKIDTQLQNYFCVAIPRPNNDAPVVRCMINGRLKGTRVSTYFN